MTAASATPAPVLVIGGAGFIGTNLCDRLAREGVPVRVFDSFARDGARANADWLATEHGDRVELIVGDLRDREALEEAVDGVSRVYHLAAQVAVTTSLADPLHDFDVNLRGTLELLEVLRSRPEQIPLVFTSTNKVYGALEDVPLEGGPQRWEPRDPELRCRGIGEDRPLAFCSPYGCSKGAADQYVLDYARAYGLQNVVFRMSCIYGPHQHGTEDQGWVAHFAIRALEGRPITLYGDGRQVRDLLYVDDLVDALLAAGDAAPRLAGRAFNIGGSPDHSASLLEVLDELTTLLGTRPEVSAAAPRFGDQRYYTSDVSAFSELTGWTPSTSVGEGIERLCAWLATYRPGLRAGLPEASGAATWAKEVSRG